MNVLVETLKAKQGNSLLYHLTPKENKSNIENKGLKPSKSVANSGWNPRHFSLSLKHDNQL